MGLFSGLKKIVKPVATAVGSFFGGPIGGAIGSTAGDVLGTIGSTVSNNLPAIIAGGAQYYGSREQNVANLLMSRETTAANREMAREATAATKEMQQLQFAENRALVDQAMGFQREMSGTAYKRAMKDLRNSGLNPILAYTQGPASTPSGATGSASAGSGTSGTGVALPQVSELSEAISSAMAARRLKKDLQVADAQIKNIHTDSLKKASEATLAHELGNKAVEDTALARAGVATAKQVVRIRKREADDTEKYGTSTLGREAAAIERIIKNLYSTITGDRK